MESAAENWNTCDFKGIMGFMTLLAIFKGHQGVAQVWLAAFMIFVWRRIQLIALLTDGAPEPPDRKVRGVPSLNQIRDSAFSIWRMNPINFFFWFEILLGGLLYTSAGNLFFWLFFANFAGRVILPTVEADLGRIHPYFEDCSFTRVGNNQFLNFFKALFSQSIQCWIAQTCRVAIVWYASLGNPFCRLYIFFALFESLERFWTIHDLIYMPVGSLIFCIFFGLNAVVDIVIIALRYSKPVPKLIPFYDNAQSNLNRLVPVLKRGFVGKRSLTLENFRTMDIFFVCDFVMMCTRREQEHPKLNYIKWAFLLTVTIVLSVSVGLATTGTAREYRMPADYISTILFTLVYVCDMIIYYFSLQWAKAEGPDPRSALLNVDHAESQLLEDHS